MCWLTSSELNSAHRLVPGSSRHHDRDGGLVLPQQMVTTADPSIFDFSGTQAHAIVRSLYFSMKANDASHRWTVRLWRSVSHVSIRARSRLSIGSAG